MDALVLRRRLRLRVASFLTLALVVASGSQSQAAESVAVPGTNQNLISWSSYNWIDSDVAADEVEQIQCPASRALPKASSTEKAAIARAMKSLQSIERPSALTSLSKLLATTTVQVQEDTLTALGLGGRLGAAAATSLALAGKSKDRRHLVNAAALLLHFGRVTAAADLLTWAEKRKPSSDPDGSATAAYLSARAEVQWRAGRFAQAESGFRQAAKASALATGPRMGVARSLKCLGELAEAARWWARAQRAIDPPSPFEDNPAADGAPQPMRPAGDFSPPWKMVLIQPLIDPNEGLAGAKFADFVPPTTPNLPESFDSEALAFARLVFKKGDNFLTSPPPGMTRVQGLIDRYADQLTRTDRSVRNTDWVIEAQTRVVMEAESNGNGPNGDGCGAVDNFNTFWPGVRRLYELHQDRANRLHQIWSAAARRVSDKAMNRYLNQVGDSMVYQQYVSFMTDFGIDDGTGGSYAWYAAEAARRVRLNDLARAMPDRAGLPLPYPDCKASFATNPAANFIPPRDPEIPGDSSICNAAAKGLNAKVGIPKSMITALPVSVEFKMNCEAGSVEIVGPKVGFLFASFTAFESAEYKYADNVVEVFAGVKGSYGTDAFGMETNIGLTVKYGVDDFGEPTILDMGVKSESTLKFTGEDGGYEYKKSMGTSFISGNEHQAGQIWFE